MEQADRLDREARETLDQSGLARPAVLHWGAHFGFWLIYLAFRTAAAHSPGMPAGMYSEFPFLTNRVLVVVCYLAATSGLLALFLWRGSARLGGWRYAILGAGAIALLPVMKEVEEWMPRLFGADNGTEPSAFLDFAFTFGWALLLWAALQAILDYHGRVVEQAHAINRAQRLAHDAQLRMLHYQINPHFLFNTLNAISTLVLERRNEQAERMLMGLSGFLRYSLDRNPNERTTLAAEIDAQRKYLEIEQTRFGEKLSVSFVVAPEADGARLPSLILQPILENAIKHAITPSAGGGRIEVSAWRDGDLLRVRVEDDGPGIAPPRPGKRRGLGLANARERLSVMYGSRAGLTAGNRPQGGCAIEFWLPFEQEEILEPAIANPVGG